MPFAPQQSRCPEGTFRGPLGTCINPPGGITRGGGLFVGSGEAVMARYGAALAPATASITVRRCPRGAVLANDGYCYNKRDLNRRDRMWVPGRKPLLTGGELNAIATAARAASKMKTQQKRLQSLGLLPKPSSGRRRHPQQMQRIGPGVQVIDTG